MCTAKALEGEPKLEGLLPSSWAARELAVGGRAHDCRTLEVQSAVGEEDHARGATAHDAEVLSHLPL